MSVQFGKWNFDGKPADPKELDEIRPVLAPYGPDGEGLICKNNLAILYRAFHTTREARRERQPYVLPSGSILTWDGRLDNRDELVRWLGGQLPLDSTDLEIVAACYERSNTDAFARLIGDWALSICDPKVHSLILAKDFIGTRSLYYTLGDVAITWSTVLDPLIALSDCNPRISEEYIAGCLSSFPATHLTPYEEIHSVPAGAFVRLDPGRQAISSYFEFDPKITIRYRRDEEYEEHFRSVFTQSVRRRLNADIPILAELSGGMDSSSIVCVADTLLSDPSIACPRLDTVSYYDDSEPNWNERPYFTMVEKKRGRTGVHIDVGAQEIFRFDFEPSFAATPEAMNANRETLRQLADCMSTQGNRVVLSGIGGDEVTGGVPTPYPELRDLLARARGRGFAHRLQEWALAKRTPLYRLLSDTVRGFLPPNMRGSANHSETWLKPDFVKRNRAALHGYPQRLKVFGPLPSFQESIVALESLRRQLGCHTVTSYPLHEKRYPFLDRDLLQFAFSIPATQWVRPSQRRSLMRRSLVGIIPQEILDRKRKAFVAREPLAAVVAEWSRLDALHRGMRLGTLGIIDTQAFYELLKTTRQGGEVSIVTLMRAIAIEYWLQTVAVRPANRLPPSRKEASDLPAVLTRDSAS
jgi:asparagine synthase (glutamine-hydrolysing)